MISQSDFELLEIHLPFWAKLTDEQRELIRANTQSIHYSKGHSLHNGENDCIGIIFIKTGSVRTYMSSDEGREITLFRLEPLDACVLSASCVLQTITFDVSVETETDCDVLIISTSVFSHIMSENVYAELFSYKLATERFSDVMWAMQQLLFTSFDKRLAGFLLDEANKNGNTTIHMTHEQIARYLGSAREVVSRMLKYFSNEKLVSLSRGDITILDKKKLQALL
jgi:CRP/FNR family transcriptional regulator